MQLGLFKAAGSFTVSLFARTQSSIERERVEVAPRTALAHALTTIHATAASITRGPSISWITASWNALISFAVGG